MYLRFIGVDFSMGLRYGSIYKVKITSDNEYIWVQWNGGKCPYSSPRTFSENWI